MRSKIAKTIIGTTALCMTLLAVSMHTGIIANAKQSASALTEQDYAVEHDAMTGDTTLENMLHSEYSGMYIYGLRDHRTYGVASGNASNDTRTDMEAFYGIRVTIYDNKRTYSIYKHTPAVLEEAEITLYEVKDGKPIKVKSLGTAVIDEENTLMIGSSKTQSPKGQVSYRFRDDRVYYIGADFTVKGLDKPQTSYGFLYYNNGELMTCRLPANGGAGMNNAIARWTRLMDGVDPDDYLSNDKITYPTSGNGKNANHVKAWEDISDELILHDDWTDEMKVFAFVDYLSKNVAYDDYRASQPHNESRANLAHDYTKDEYFTLKNNVGVCWDYVNILTIMCRHWGIPATSVENEKHTINAIWLDGEWVSVDMTEIAKYKCKTEDTSRENWTKYSMASYSYYGGYGGNDTFETVDESIWTYERGLGIK